MIKVLIFKECGMYVAQGILDDIGAQGKDLIEVTERFIVTYELQTKLPLPQTPDIFVWNNPNSFDFFVDNKFHFKVIN